MTRRRSFGEREGRLSAPSLAKNEISEELRTAIWNECHEWLFAQVPMITGPDPAFHARMRILFRGLGWRTDEITRDSLAMQLRLRLWLFLEPDPDWIEFYNFVELLPKIAALPPGTGRPGELEHIITCQLNLALERHGSPYRLADGQLVPITSEKELEEIDRALSSGDRFAPARSHINQAVAHLAKRPDPAYRDCIKEAVSAVESTLWIANNKKEDFKDALRTFEAKYSALHRALCQALKNLYGYASDEQGVRHGATEPSSVGEREARFMLVTCSAAMNFLIRKTETI